MSHKSSLGTRRRLRRAQEKAEATQPLGGGGRFRAVEASAAASGARNPAGVAAAAGRKKYGKKRFQALAAAGRRRSR